MAPAVEDGRPAGAGEGARPSTAAPLALFVLLAAAVAAAGALAYGASAGDLRRDRERELAAIAALKVGELERWRAERLADAHGVAANPAVLAALAARGEPPAAVTRELEAWFDVLRGVGEYAAIAVADVNGRLRFSAGILSPTAGRVPPELIALVRRAVDERRAVISDLHQHGAGDPVHLTVVAPVPTGGGVPHAVLLRVDPYRWLFRMLQSWPVASPTGETLLVRTERGRAVVVNEPRHPAEPGALAPAPGRPEDPIVRAALGALGVFDAVDERGVRVLAAVHPVPDTAWRLVAKMDADEALAPLSSLRAWVLAGVLALLVAAGAAAAYWWRAQVAAFERARLRAEAERLALARRLEQLTKFARDMVFLADDHQRILEVNDRALALLGYAREELVGQPVRTLRDPATVGDYEARTAEQVEEGSAVFETRYRRKDGTTFPVEVSAHTETVDGRRYFHAVSRDITERKLAEEALRASEEKFRAAFEFASLGIILVAPDGALVETNRAMRRMLGRGEDELRAETFEGIHGPQDRASAAAILRQMREGAVGAVELPRRLLRRDGALAEVVLRASALRDDGGRFRFALAVVEDVTDRKRLESQLMLADRMASVGTLAAGVAHEINNPLAFILANLEFALAELRGVPGVDPDLPRALAEARDGGLRVREIVRDLKAFSRADAEEAEAVDLRRVLQSALGLAQNEIRHRARIEVDPGDVPPVLGSEHRIGQVLLNLLINAAQAIPEGSASDHVVRAVTSTAPDGRACVAISDTGAGIPPDVLPRIFDPFFTTKPVGVGTGLGLSICHGIVSGLGGEIRVDSQPGKGSRFTVLLPPAPAGARHDGAPPAAVPAAPPKRGRILVVDDEPLVGRAVARILGPLHEVVALPSARSALEAVAGGAPFDLVLCDLMMPEVTGMELHARLAEVAPALAERTVFLTGGAFTPGAREFLARVANPRIEKPFEPDELRTLVARVLAERPLRVAG